MKNRKVLYFLIFQTYLYAQKDSLNRKIDSLESKFLKEVKVQTKKKVFEQKVDRLVFNVENATSAVGGDALQTLKITPNIRVQNDKISMIGKSGMLVMLNDTPVSLSGEELANFLKSIPADNIKSIEVITTPPAKYSAEGNSGIINIILKKVKNDSWNASLRSTYTQTTYAGGSFGGNFNLQKNKISLSSNLNYSNGSYAPEENSLIYYPQTIWDEQTRRRDFYDNINGRLNFGYQVNDKLNLGMQIISSIGKPHQKNTINTYLKNSITQKLDSLVNTNSNNSTKNNYHSLNLNSTYKIDTLGKKINFNLDYLNFDTSNNMSFKTNHFDTNTLFIPNSYFSANNNSNQKINNYSANIDVEMPFKKFEINYGARTVFTKTNNNVSFYNLTNGNSIFDSSRSNEFNYKENTQALYFSINKPWNDKWETQFGLRFETTQTTGTSITNNQTNENNYSKIFPTFYLSYTPNEQNSFSFDYSKRINRPSFSRLNPFRWYNNPFSYTEGNPFLQPSFTDNFELNYTYKDIWINNFYVSHTKDGFEQITIVDNSNNNQKTTPLNFFNTFIIGLTETFVFKKLKWWTSFNTANIHYSEAKANLDFTLPLLSGWNATLSTKNDFILNTNKTLFFNFSYEYNFNGVSDLDKSTAYNQLDISFRALFLDKNLELGFAVNDVFSSNRPIYTSFTNDIRLDYRNYYDDRLFRLSLSYRFGNKKIQIQNKSTGNEEERGRIN